jgi:soluble lytic murein transglycosylase
MYRLLPLLLLLILPASACNALTSVDESRRLYREALLEISQGRIANAEKLAPKLQNYALYPYLELELLKAQINQVSSQTIDVYLQQYGATVVGQRIRIAWLNKLLRSRDWPQFIRYYQANYNLTTSCHYAFALRQTGADQLADATIKKIWATPYSLPKECDAPIKLWFARLTPKQVEAQHWHRAILAVEKGQSGLAKYLLKKIPDTNDYNDLLRQPELLHQRGLSMKATKRNRDIAVHTLKRLAKGDFERTNTLWHRLDTQLHFSAKQNYELRDSISRQIIASDAYYTRDWITANDPNYEDPYLTEWQIRLALKDRDWAAIPAIIDHLPADKKQKSDWRYWAARADIELRGKISADTQLKLQALAAERSYYGFMASDILNEDYQFAAERSLDPALVAEIEQHRAVTRARELYWLGETLTASYEWNQAMRSLNQAEQVAAAQLALNWGWSHQAITTAIRADEWNDLTLRFPTPFTDSFRSTAERENIELKWIYAIARQESAFLPTANSSVGARGIMQLMPGTANLVARQMGLPRPSTTDLVTPGKNIAMGGYYLGQLLEQFNGNRILATAAYNAGPGRIERVLARQQLELPADIWIENLPYGETREYIKNVLAFSVIYAEKLKLNRPLLARHERNIGPQKIQP